MDGLIFAKSKRAIRGDSTGVEVTDEHEIGRLSKEVSGYQTTAAVS